jgi:hypothetical protein
VELVSLRAELLDGHDALIAQRCPCHERQAQAWNVSRPGYPIDSQASSASPDRILSGQGTRCRAAAYADHPQWTPGIPILLR